MHATLFESTIISRLNYIGLENLQKYSDCFSREQGFVIDFGE